MKCHRKPSKNNDLLYQILIMYLTISIFGVKKIMVESIVMKYFSLTIEFKSIYCKGNDHTYAQKYNK